MAEDILKKMGFGWESCRNHELDDNFLTNLVKETIDDLIEEFTVDIMSMKSLSLGEANLLAKRFILMNINPKSNEFYEYMDKIR